MVGAGLAGDPYLVYGVMGLHEVSLVRALSWHPRPVSACCASTILLIWGVMLLSGQRAGEAPAPWKLECGKLAGLPSGTGSVGMPEEAAAASFPARRPS